MSELLKKEKYLAEISWEDITLLPIFLRFLKYINIVKNSVSEAAKQIIKSLWLVQRRLQQVTVKNYVTTISWAAAHAKLCRCKTADLCDAVIAIYIMEEHHCLNEQSILGFVAGKRNIDSYGKDFVRNCFKKKLFIAIF